MQVDVFADASTATGSAALTPNEDSAAIAAIANQRTSTSLN
jgi:hypothetical protein